MDFLLLSAARHTTLLKAFMSQFEVFIIMIFGVQFKIFFTFLVICFQQNALQI